MVLRWLLLILPSILLLSSFLAVTPVWGDDFPKKVLFGIDNPSNVHGRFGGDLQVAVTEQGYCLVSSTDSKATFEASVEFTVPTSSLFLKLHGKGRYIFEIYHPHIGWKSYQINHNEDSYNWEQIELEQSQLIGYIRYRIRLSDENSFFCKLIGPDSIPLDGLWPFTVSKQPMKVTTGSWSGTIGVNMEAEYLFLELDRDQRRLLLKQAWNDGFCSIRLHKLTRLAQALDFHPYFRETLQTFLNDLVDVGFSLSLDILSWPLETSLSTGQIIKNGWKQWVYTSSELQGRVFEIIEWLGKFYLDGSLLYQSDKLIGICLFNENSLFAEAPIFTTSNLKNPCKRMLRVGSLFRNVLQEEGYEGRIFLSNYQLDGVDQICNMQFSDSIDRHLYFDYPEFIDSVPKVGGRSPLEFLESWRSKYLDLFKGASERWISEINLPWPNQFSHEMLPIILALHKEKILKGIWFYDYRLRSSDFHLGGPFGIQRFRSVIEPLGWFKSLLNESYKLEYQNFLLRIYSDRGSVKCFLRGHPIKRVPHCIWERNDSSILTGPERSLGDQFDPQFLFQTSFGQSAMHLGL